MGARGSVGSGRNSNGDLGTSFCASVCNFIEGVFPGEVPDRCPWGTGDNERERSVPSLSERWSRFVSPCCWWVRNECAMEEVRVPLLVSWFHRFGSTDQRQFQIRPFPNRHTCVRIRPIPHLKSARLPGAVLPPLVQMGLYSSRGHLILLDRQHRQRPSCCCVNARRLK